MEKLGILQVTVECCESSLVPKLDPLGVEVNTQHRSFATL